MLIRHHLLAELIITGFLLVSSSSDDGSGEDQSSLEDGEVAPESFPNLFGSCNKFSQLEDVFGRCRDGVEVGGLCTDISSGGNRCYTESCSGFLCRCDVESGQCEGCLAEGAVCVRIEQPQMTVPLQICEMSMVHVERGSGGLSQRPSIDTFSVGGRGAIENDYSHMVRLVENADILGTQCVTFEGTSDESGGFLPAFFQANANTDDPNEIGTIRFSGPNSDSLIGSMVYVNGDWVKTVEEDDIVTDDTISILGVFGLGNSDDTAVVEIEYWPRTVVGFDELESLVSQTTSQGKHFTVLVEGTQAFSSAIPAGVGVEFCGVNGTDPTLQIVGVLEMAGRVSFKQLMLDMEVGTINIQGPLLIQESEVVNLDRCPFRFREIEGLCVIATPIPEVADDSELECLRFKGGFLPKASDLVNPQMVGSLLGPTELAWIAPSTSTAGIVATLDSYGNIVERASSAVDFFRTICATPVNLSLIGRLYTSCFSKQYLPNNRELYERLIDLDRLPTQIGSSLSVIQEDLDPEELMIFNVSDARPKFVKVDVVLADGSNSAIAVGLDTFDFTSVVGSGIHQFEIFDDSRARLPTRVHVHAVEPVCVERVDVYLRDEMGTDRLSLSIAAEIFSVCLELNVCDANTEQSCGRSLLYYDESNKCAVLRQDDAKFPRDLSFVLTENFCGRLTTWRHPGLGEPLLLEVLSTVETDGSSPVEVGEIATQDHRYSFNNREPAVVDESNRIPVNFTLSGGVGATVNSIRVTRYNLTLAGASFDELYDCINLCQSMASPNGIILGQTELAYLALLEIQPCRRLPYIKLPNNSTGREACTTNRVNITSFDELEAALGELEDSSQPYRTLQAYVNEEFVEGNGTLTLPPRRGLSLFADFDVLDENPIINGINFEATSLSELLIEGFDFSGGSRIFVGPLGDLDFSGGNIDLDVDACFLLNAGTASLVSVAVVNKPFLCNTQKGFLDLVYVRFRDSSGIVNTADGTVRLSRVLFYEDFEEPSLLEGSLELPDARRLYNRVNETSDLCQLNLQQRAILNNPMPLNARDCLNLCEQAPVCSGAFFYIDEETYSPECVLCPTEELCTFNCSIPSSQYSTAESKFLFQPVVACPTFSRFFATLSDNTTLEECKLYCTYYDSCEGFTYDSQCRLIADLDFRGGCSAGSSDEMQIYIPFIEGDPDGFVPVPGTPAESPLPIAIHESLSFDKCAAVCTKTLTCSSFVVSAENVCSLYTTTTFTRSAGGDELYIVVDEIFPKKRYFSVEGCPVENFYDSHNTKIQDRCQTLCDLDLSCVGYTFINFTGLDERNCMLFRRETIVSELFGSEEADCDVVNITVSFATESFVTSSARSFGEVYTSSDLLFDECKAICLADDQCIALKYDLASMNCTIGDLGDPSDVVLANDTYLALVSDSADISSGYLLVPGVCYVGEPLLGTPDPEPENTAGYISLPRLCSTSNVLRNSTGSPPECGLLCDSETECNGFVYYPDYGDLYNDGKVGKCSFISGSITFGGEGCNAPGELTDIYLKASRGAVCSAKCDIHQLCSAFVYDDEVGCLLFSDIAILSNNTPCDVRVVQLGLGYRERDALVQAEGQCFVEFEDLAEIDCFAIDDGDDSQLGAAFKDLANNTPYACQQRCREQSMLYYSVRAGSDCYCSNELFFNELETSSACNVTCTGDNSQFCGGEDAVAVGSSRLPIPNVTEAQCKKICFDSSDCIALNYNPTSSSCELRASDLFSSCADPANVVTKAFIESLEHYYERPTSAYIGDTVVYRTTTELRQECQRLCDGFSACEAIRYLDELTVYNCEILGGSIVDGAINGSISGVEVARDVTLFTKAEEYTADSEASIKIFGSVFDLDECGALCEAHVLCGAFVFASRACTLYRGTSFAVLTNSESSTPYYVDYKGFVDIERQFVEAENLCVDEDAATAIATRKTVLSPYDCASRCNRDTECGVFAYGSDRLCVLYENDAALSSDCIGVVPETKTYVLYTRGQFTQPSSGQSTFLVDEENSLMEEFQSKSVVTCAALCDEAFSCRSFRVDPTNDSFCVSRAGAWVIDDVPLEACKTVCEKLPLCLSFEHNQDGDCQLYSSSDFSVPCEADPDRTLYIGYSEKVVDRPDFEYTKLQNCFDVEGVTTSTAKSMDKCESDCSDDDDCFAYQYNSTASMDCVLLSGELPTSIDCTTNTNTFLKVASNPYQLMDKTCLRNPIEFDDPILDTEEIECLALCDAHPFCRYFLHGKDPSRTKPLIRECVLFSAQSVALDDCEGYGGEYDGLPGFVNGRTFVDQITWFDEPIDTFAVIEGVSYQECASLCDSLDSQCNAFLHTWNYRRISSAGAEFPVLFSPTRLIKANFETGALFLEYDADDEDLILARSQDKNRGQYVIFESVTGGEDQFRLKFQSDPRFCVAAMGNAVPINDSYIRDVVLPANFMSNPVPVCQQIGMELCDNENVIVFEEVSAEDRIAFQYTVPGTTSNEVGCLRFPPESPDFVVTAMDEDGGELTIPPKEGCEQEVSLEPAECTKTEKREVYEDPSGNLFSTSWVLVDNGCANVTVDELTCSVSNVTVDGITTTTITTCQEPGEPPQCDTGTMIGMVEVLTEEQVVLTEDMLNVTLPVDSTKSVFSRTCTIFSPMSSKSCYSIAYGGLDILEMMHQFYANQAQCTPAEGKIFSRSYADGCGFDEKLVSIPSQLFSFASDPTKVFNDNQKGCLTSSLTLEPCASVNAVQWIHLFSGGQIFYSDTDNEMRCLTSLESVVSLEQCSSAVNTSQAWTLNMGDRTIVDSSEMCLLPDENGTIAIGNCSRSEARWSPYSECRLNSRTTTAPMKVESFDPRLQGKCIHGGVFNDDGKPASLVDCTSTSADTWVYHYDQGDGEVNYRLQKYNTAFCLGRGTEITDLDLDPLNKYTGLQRCIDTQEERANSLYWFMTLGGDESNVFQWPFVFNNGSSIDYCIDVPQPEQHKCSEVNDPPGPAKWRKFEANDQGVLRQFFLLSAEGKQLRTLRAKTAGLQRDVDRAFPLLTRSESTVSDALGLLQSASAPIGTLSSSLNTGEIFFKTIATVLIPLEYIPYVGPVIRGTRLRGISKQVSKRMKDGTKGLDRANRGFDAAILPISGYGALVALLSSSLTGGMIMLTGLVDYITNVSFCAFQLSFDAEYKRLQEWITKLLKVVNATTSALRALARSLSVLDKLKGLMQSDIFRTFRVFRGILKVFQPLYNVLSFILALADFSISIPIPRFYGCRLQLLFFSIPWICFEFKNFTFTLEVIGEFLSKIERLIKSIPLVGQLWTAIENFIGSIISELFKGIGIEIPSFGLNLGFLDDIRKDLSDAVARILKLFEMFDGIFLLNGDLFQRLLEALDTVMESLPDDLIDLPNICDESCALPDGFGFQFHDSDPFPAVEIGGLNYTVPTEAFETLVEFSSHLEEVEDEMENFFGSGIVCNKFETFGIDVPEQLERLLNVNISNIGVPSCPLDFRLCTDISFDKTAYNSFADKVNQLFDQIFANRRRRLQSSMCENYPDWGLVIPLNPGTSLLGTLVSQIQPSKLSLDVKRGTFPWRLYWHKFLGDNFISKFLRKGPFGFLTGKPQIAFGCVEGEVHINFKYEGMVSVSVNPLVLANSKFPWKPSHQGKKSVEIRKDSDDEATFSNEMSDVLGLKFNDYRCRFEFVAATVHALNTRIEGMRPDPFTDSFDRFLAALQQEQRNGRMDRFGFPEPQPRFSGDQRGISDTLVNQAMELRARFQSNLGSKEARRRSKYYFYDAYKGIYQSGGKCAGPQAPRFLSSSPTEFVGSLIGYAGSITYHPLAYKNLFGSGLAISIIQQQLLTNQEIRRADIPLALRGPFPQSFFVDYAAIDTEKCENLTVGEFFLTMGELLLGNFKEFNLGIFFKIFSNLGVDLFYSKPPATQYSASRAVDAMEKEHMRRDVPARTFASRVNLGLKFSFGGVVLGIKGGSRSGSSVVEKLRENSGAACSPPIEGFEAGGICTGLGFDPDGQVPPFDDFPCD